MMLFPEEEEPKVYVGTWEWPFRNMIMFHMASTNVEALHRMAAKIGINRKWFQNKETVKGSGECLEPHYDICKSKKQLALKYGAVEIDDRELIKICFPKLDELIGGKRKI